MFSSESFDGGKSFKGGLADRLPLLYKAFPPSNNSELTNLHPTYAQARPKNKKAASCSDECRTIYGLCLLFCLSLLVHIQRGFAL